VAERGRLTRYGGYWGNKIPRVDENQHRCLVEKREPSKARERNPLQKISLLRGLDGSTITEIGCCRLITCTP